MTIGGYKFKGYHYILPSDYTSADRNQELLRMFKCRLSAFFDSCQLSGANWVPMYQGNGTYDFYGYQKIIFEISNSDPTYAVFFKYSNEENYLVLVSENCGLQAQNTGYYYYTYNNINYYNHNHDSSAVSLIQLTPENFKTVSSNRLSLRGVYIGGTSSYASARNPLSVSYGFVTKDKDIIEFYNADSLQAYWYCKVMSPDAFSLLSNPDDHFGLFSTACVIQDTQNTGSNTLTTYNTPLIKECQLLKNTGEEYTIGGSADNINNMIDIYGFSDRMSFYNYASDYVPYVSPVITNNTLRLYGADQLINTNGIYSKGLIRSELLAINSPAIRGGQSLGISAGSTYANSNYLCIYTLSPYYSSSIPQLVQGAVYCGWDPSNPPLKQNTSYTEYTD